MRYPCWLLSHSIVWEYDAGERSCHQRGYCEKRDCKKIDERIVHNFGSWGSSDSKSCEIKRTCIRCGTLEYSTEHNYEWRYYTEGTCEQNQVCIRCRILADTGVAINHVWKGWELSRDGNFLQNVCTRCSEFREKPARATST